MRPDRMCMPGEWQVSRHPSDPYPATTVNNAVTTNNGTTINDDDGNRIATRSCCQFVVPQRDIQSLVPCGSSARASVGLVTLPSHRVRAARHRGVKTKEVK